MYNLFQEDKNKTSIPVRATVQYAPAHHGPTTLYERTHTRQTLTIIILSFLLLHYHTSIIIIIK